MQTYDWIMLLVLAGATVFGFWKGMAWQIASLASLVVSYFASLRFSAQLAPMFGQQAPLNRLSAMLAIYVATSFVIWMIFRLVSELIDRVKLESFDRQLGGMLGFAKGVLFCVAITFFAVGLLPPQQGQAIVDSRAGHYIVVLLNKAHDVVPPELNQRIGPYLDKIEERLGNNPGPPGQNVQNHWPQTGGGEASPTGWPQPGQTQPPAQAAWPQIQQPQSGWPAAGAQTSQPWPAESREAAPSAADPYRSTNALPVSRESYNSPREPNPFPGSNYPTNYGGENR